jgi:formiminoglutamase/agmatinase
MPSRYALIGYPFDGGSSLGKPGARYAPAAIREALGWIQMRIVDGKLYDVEAEQVLDLSDVEIRDFGDAPIVPADIDKTVQRTRDMVAQVVRDGYFPIVFGGDDSGGFPAMAGLHDATPGMLGIIHMDAHFDLLEESEAQGRLSQSSPIRRSLELERVEPRNVIQIGVRGFNFARYLDYTREQNISRINALQFHRAGPEAAAAQARLVATRGRARVGLLFDIDVLDSAFAPGSGANEPGGLTSRQWIDFQPLVAT